MRTARPLADKRSGGPDLARIIADLDHVRALGQLAPARLESLRDAAHLLRNISAAREAMAAHLAVLNGESTVAIEAQRVGLRQEIER